MNNFKFRVWNIIASKMQYWGEIFDLPAWEIFPGTPEQRAFNVMQYSGLKGFMSDKFSDSEEKEVYQGDYITIFHESFPAGYYSEEYITGVVDLDETGTAFIIKNAKFESNGENIPRNVGDMEISVSTPSDEDLEEVFLHYFDLTSDDITIHGNIYENPELLEVGK